MNAKLNLVDLAGSERVKDAGVTGEALKEAAKINQSLMALSGVVNALTKGGKGIIPYNESSLTRLLKDSLGGNCRTAMIACVAPIESVAEDTRTTLHFASRAKTIQNHAKVNIEAGDHASSSLLAQYEAQLAQLREQLKQAEMSNYALSVHLRQATAGGGQNGEQPPDIF